MEVHLYALNQFCELERHLRCIRGAGAGNGTSTIVSNRSLTKEEVWYVADFVLLAAHLEPAIITSGKIVRCADPTSVVEYVSGATRLRQCAMDKGRWPVDDGYLDIYINRIVKWSEIYTWAAINRYDRAFRRSMHVAGAKASWRVLDVDLHASCLLDEPAARLSYQYSGDGRGGDDDA